MENYDFEKIPLWDNNDIEKSFEILSDKVNGRIPVTRIENWRSLTELLESKFFNRKKASLVFRGHRRFDWALMPTLARVTQNGIIDEQLASEQLEYFKLAVRGRLADSQLVEEGEEDELWSVGQHHGLLTPMLDWTYSPYVALFFAFAKEDSDEENENPYRTIYVLNKSFVADKRLCPDIRIFEPRKDHHGRLVNQAGLFTFSPYDSTIENKLIDTLSNEDFPDDRLRTASLTIEDGETTNDQLPGILAEYICKIFIKNEDRNGCLKHLRKMNVHHASLFPDLIGASEYCNLIIAEQRREYEIEQSAKRTESNPPSLQPITESRTPIDPSSDITGQLVTVLYNHSTGSVEPGRIQLIAEHLSKELNSLMVVDWNKRDTAKASMRTLMRINLRKYDFPVENRNTVIEEIMKILEETQAVN